MIPYLCFDVCTSKKTLPLDALELSRLISSLPRSIQMNIVNNYLSNCWQIEIKKGIIEGQGLLPTGHKMKYTLKGNTFGVLVEKGDWIADGYNPIDMTWNGIPIEYLEEKGYGTFSAGRSAKTEEEVVATSSVVSARRADSLVLGESSGEKKVDVDKAVETLDAYLGVRDWDEELQGLCDGLVLSDYFSEER